MDDWCAGGSTRCTSGAVGPDRQPQHTAFDELRAPFQFVVVDWKTGRADQADPLQLALYRQAWADLRGVPVDQVDAAFYDVRADRLLRPVLPDRAEIENLLGPL